MDRIRPSCRPPCRRAQRNIRLHRLLRLRLFCSWLHQILHHGLHRLSSNSRDARLPSLFLICGAGSTSSSSSCGSSSASSRPSEERPALRTARVFLGFPLALAFDFPAGFDFAFAFPAALVLLSPSVSPSPSPPGLVVPCSPASCRISSAALQADGGSTKRCQCVWRSKINKRVPPK